MLKKKTGTWLLKSSETFLMNDMRQRLATRAVNVLLSEIMLKCTCIGLQVFRGHHDNKTDCPFIAEHFVGPAADGAHALNCCNAIVGNKHLEKQSTSSVTITNMVKSCCSSNVMECKYTDWHNITIFGSEPYDFTTEHPTSLSCIGQCCLFCLKVH